MIKGLYTAASGMVATRRQLDIVSNNLANVNTGGYKRSGGVRESFPEILVNRLVKGEKAEELGTLGTGSRLQKTYTDFKAANIKQTGNKLDLAIKGEGFFVVQTPAGQKYTRNGNFTLNQQGQIVTQQGYPVIGERGVPLQTINGRDINIDNDGQLYLGDLTGDRFMIVDFTDRDVLKKSGDNLYELREEAGQEQIQNQEPAEDYQLLQGYLEGSNVNVVQEMVKMIETNRLYQANQKVIQTIDSTLGKAVNEVGRLG